MGAAQLLEHTRADNAAAYDENYIYDMMVNHLDGAWWDEVKGRGRFDRIAVPFFSVGNWTSFHFRGNTEAFERAASKDKLFRVHIGGRLTEYYSDEGKTEQLRFYDHWLKGMDTGMMREPRVLRGLSSGEEHHLHGRRPRLLHPAADRAAEGWSADGPEWASERRELVT
jgi:uncharacterized protein